MDERDREAARLFGGLCMFLSTAALVAILTTPFIGEPIASSLGVFVFGFLAFAVGNDEEDDD